MADFQKVLDISKPHLRPYVEGEASVAEVRQCRQGLLPVRPLALDRQLVVARVACVDVTFDLFAHRAGTESVARADNL